MNAGLGPNTAQFCERLEMLIVLRAAKIIKKTMTFAPGTAGSPHADVGLSGRGGLGQGDIFGIAKRVDDADSLAVGPWGVP